MAKKQIINFSFVLFKKGAEAPYFVLAPLIRAGSNRVMPVMTKTPSAATDRIRLVKSTSTDKTSSASAMLTRAITGTDPATTATPERFLQHHLFFLIDAVVISDIQAQTQNVDRIGCTGNVGQLAHGFSVSGARGCFVARANIGAHLGDLASKRGERGQSGDGFSRTLISFASQVPSAYAIA
jgi:hypothetical protein